jgi:hypothetical protein
MPDQARSGISGVAVVAVFAGGILAWSGVKGWKLSFVTQDILSGKDPKNDPRIASSALTVSPEGIFGGLLGSLVGNLVGSSGGSGNTQLLSQSGSSGRFGSAFAKSVLATIHAPITPQNVASIEAWARREGGGGANNPLNTTYGSPQSGISGVPGTTFNSVGVMNYPSQAWGVLATAHTILGGGYGDIVAALRSGNGLCGRSFSGLSTWSGGGYSSVC